jgi:ribulose-bisphosphate carboxylase large chain
LAQVMCEPMGDIKPMMPAVSGGLNPRTLGANLAAFGADALMLAGSGITTHPLGIKAGTAALRQAAEAFQAGTPLADFAKTHRELQAVL